MRGFQDGMWIAKALKRDKHRESFNELHESLTYIFQVGTCGISRKRPAARVDVFVSTLSAASVRNAGIVTWPERPCAPRIELDAAVE